MTPAGKLLRWYRTHGRKLPWRETRDPYRILVSEVMLQQTQVERVKVFYRSWLKQFPSWKTLAEASNAEVIHAWAGLGYNRRALMLRDIARDVCLHGVPTSEDAWRRIKGIGPYTSSAMSAFAQKKRTLPIDTNIRRVLGRVLLGKPFPELSDDEMIGSHADSFIPRRGAYYDVPQAIFDLATSVCIKNPDCKSCPLRNDCKSAKQFLEGRVKIPKRSIAVTHERKHRNKPYPDRIYRGRILKVVREQGQIGIRELGPLVDPNFNKILDQIWVEAMVGRLITHALLSRRKNILTLPE